MEHEGSLQCSQELATGPCLEPDEYSPHYVTISLRSILILSSQLRVGVDHLKFCTHFSSTENTAKNNFTSPRMKCTHFPKDYSSH
jgi:hypothetical protein